MKRVTNTPGTPAYSDAIVTPEGTIFTSGHIPEADGEVVLGTIEEETTLTLEGILATVELAGGDKGTFVRCNVAMRDLDEFVGFDAAYRAFFGASFPARTTIEANLIEGVKIEIDAIALAGSA